VAVALGAVFLDELITVATVIGFVLVLAGCWFATRTSRVMAGDQMALVSFEHSTSGPPCMAAPVGDVLFDTGNDKRGST
ncbi:MAG: hypothetical protein M3P52_12655, partial [Actinomycetota bacterium]|nr:hypothetical protein [Actinomycetota bacterium]